MAEMKPIIFSTPMLQAILEGRKTQTRRVITNIPGHGRITDLGESETPGYKWCFRDKKFLWHEVNEIKSPYKTGDILWVRETWADMHFVADILGHDRPETKYLYMADYSYETFDSTKWRPSLFMPREAARIFLEVKSVRVERLQEISEADANAEDFCFGCDWFHDYWDSLNAKRGYGWDSNPWVWVIGFERKKE
jgi:hypothetical protein